MSDHVKLGDYTDLLTGHPFKSSGYIEDHRSGIRLLRGNNMGQGHVRWGNAKFWPADDRAAYVNYQLRTGDVVLAMDRPWIEAGLKYSEIRPEDTPSLLVQRVARLRARPGLEQRYLAYLVGSKAFTDYVLSAQTGTAVPHISGSQIKDFSFILPDLRSQRAISEALGSLDDKIAVNNCIANTCMDLAEHILLHETRHPENARAIYLSDAAVWHSGGTPKTSEASYWSGSIPWISAASLKGFFISTSDRKLTELGTAHGTRVVPSGTTLCVVRGMSLKTEFRMGITTRKVAFGQDCKAFTPRDDIGAHVFAYALRSRREAVLKIVDEAGHGTGRLESKLLGSIELGIPVPARMSEVEERLSNLSRNASLRNEESRALAELRDTLLPKFMSGELRLRDAEKLVEDAA